MSARFRLMRKYAWLVFALVFAWKVGLFIVSMQPVPANDAYFYDGAVIHYLLHGGYFNPCVAQAFPISGTQIFSAYPPGYQLPLLAWMSVFGVSGPSAMGLHITLFGGYLVVLLAIFRRLQIPAWCVNLAGGFLLTFTFHDRPDSFAHLLGVLAVYCCVRSRGALGRDVASDAGFWPWFMALFIVLAFTASLQIGGIYLLVVWIATFAACRVDKEPIPLIPLAVTALVPALLALLVKIKLPTAWAGFMENVHQTPFLTGLRMTHLQEVLKIIRTVPGILVVTLLLTFSFRKEKAGLGSILNNRYGIVLLAALLPALGILVASLTIIAPNTVAISNYLQPIIVAAYLAWCVSRQVEWNWMRLQVICLVPAILLGSVRAVGMTTWGLACAKDVSYSTAVQRVHQEIDPLPAKSKIVMSSAFLYAISARDDLNVVHSDWMTRAGGDSRVSDSRALLELKPEKLILTQYDYHRRFKAVLERVKADPELKDIQVTDLARTPTPDSIKSLQQVVQHVSWAPVVVNLSWRE
jgi:hypothetical protein